MIITAPETALWKSRTLRCALGEGGVRERKREGDGATPAGSYRFLRVLYRQDRIDKPQTLLPVTPIAPTDGWCDDPGHSDYNCPVNLPHDASCESLWRTDNLYDMIVVTDHNANPVIPGNGSAVFVLVAAQDYSATRGCIAFSLADLLDILAEWAPSDRMNVAEAWR